MEQPSSRGTQASGLFTGGSAASRGFELAIFFAAVAMAARLLLLPPAASVPPFTGPAGALAVALAVALIALGGIFPLPLGHKIHLSLGSGAAFAALLIFPPHQALPVAFAGTLIAQAVRRRRGYRLTSYTIIFNQVQYVLTWSLVVGTYFRARADLLSYPALSWLPVVAAGAVYVLVNTWIVTTRSALRSRAWTWDLWVRALREAGFGYAVSLFLGAAVARLAAARPLLVLPLFGTVILVYWILSRMSGIHLRQTSAVLAALVEFAERRSPGLVEHSERVSWWAERLARHLGVPEHETEAVAIAAKLHDLGKTLLPKDLEEKPGRLTEEEWAVMRQHPILAAASIRRSPGMEPVAKYIQHHHERYDGKGYPDGLSGEEIPLGARIIAVADCYDAMLTPRAYRQALPSEEAARQLAAGAGTQFDPRVVTALLALVGPKADGRRAIVSFPRSTEAMALAGAGGIFSAGPSTERLADDGPSHRLVAVQEAERRRIARELHDEIGQALTGLKFTLETVPRLPAQNVQARLHEAQEVINELISRVHNLSLELRPAMLDDLGLLPALLWYFERYTSRTGVQVVFRRAAALDGRFSPAVETAAYRIVQEALTNVARYAGVGEATVVLWIGQGTLCVQIEDRGKGFDPERLRATAGATGGLAGMRERALMLGGRLTVDSAPGAGTNVRAELPLDTSVEEARTPH